MEMGEKIRTLRKVRGWSQGELAAHIGVSRQSVSKWELAEAAPDAGNIVKLCNLFEISADAFLALDQSAAIPAQEDAPTAAPKARPAWYRKKVRGIVLLAVGLVIVAALVVLSLFVPARMRVEHTYSAADIVMLTPGPQPEAERSVTSFIEAKGLLPFLNTYYLHGLFAGGFVLIGFGVYDLIRAQREKRRILNESGGEADD